MSEPFINDPADRDDGDLTEEEFKAAMGDSALELKLRRGLAENRELWQSNSELRAKNDRLPTALGILMPFVLEDYFPDLAMPAYKAAVEGAIACMSNERGLATAPQRPDLD